MEIRCRCPACQAKFKVDAKYAGKRARCPKCQQVVEVPLENPDASTTSLTALGAPQPVSGTSAIVQPKPAPPPMANKSTILPPMPVASAPAAAAPAPAVAAATPAAETPAETGGAFAGFQISTNKPSGPRPAAASKSATNLAAGGKKKQQSVLLPLIVGGGLLAVVLLVGGAAAVWALSQPATAGGGQASGKGGTNATATTGTLVLDWPDADSKQASVSIDGRREPFGTSFKLTPGTHKLSIQRRGYEPFETEVTLARGATEHVAPEWKAVATVAVATPAASGQKGTPVNPAVGGSGGFPIGTAVPAGTVRGFEGWLQSMDQAKTQAAAEKKDILVVFAISDLHSKTQQLAQLLQRGALQAQTAGMVKVVIDFPRTQSASEAVQDSAQNEQLREEFCVDNYPAVVVTDETGKGYFFQEQWEQGISAAGTKFGEWQKQRAERDQLLAAAQQGTPDEQLTAAAKAVKWLQDHLLFQFYRAEVDGWLGVAQKSDPDNQKSLLETFFEPQWFLQAQMINHSDSVAVGRLVGQLDPWVARKFQDHDRGAKLHLFAAHLLQSVKDIERFQAHLEHAAHYQPKDNKLADALKHLRMMLENKDIVSNGTGYLISPAGYVLTNHHVTDGPGAIAIRLPGTSTNVPAQLIAQDADRDIALIKVALPDAEKFQPLAIAPDPIRRGASVAAFGYPLVTAVGTGLKFTDGAVSAVPDDTNDQMYLLDVTVNPGNSGGPLCDRRGNVVGMVTAKTGNSGFESSYGLAVPSADLIKFLDKHLPPGTPRVPPSAGEANLGWDQVDEKVSSGVLMIVKKR